MEYWRGPEWPRVTSAEVGVSTWSPHSGFNPFCKRCIYLRSKSFLPDGIISASAITPPRKGADRIQSRIVSAIFFLSTENALTQRGPNIYISLFPGKKLKQIAHEHKRNPPDAK
jgi:hypothetical protein